MLSKSSCLSESLVLCTSEVRPNYFPIFYNISPAAMRAFLFPSFSIALVQLLLSFCKESANLGKEIHSQLWQGGKSHISRDHRPWVSDENILRWWWWWWYHNQWHGWWSKMMMIPQWHDDMWEKPAKALACSLIRSFSW